ncbi:hypothetical protein [Actinokineospora iranica]|uniref:hypothetical protein n=1 Tax=Actinokineospora iranica TaxID=1271860 RepID=UPI000B89DA93|nr:hypothetical protein [Actinokineospora iranica]
MSGKPGRRDRGRDIAWCAQCPACAAVVADQLEVVLDRPDGAPIQIRRCRWCGAERVCRPTWATRCHICLDDRTSPESEVMAMGRELVRRTDSEPDLADLVRSFLGLGKESRVPVRGAAEFAAATALVGELAEYEQPGWTVLAGDVHGLPWFGARWLTWSHGTWGRHDRCGRVRKLDRGHTECAVCEPEPGSRTHRARADDQHLLYLVGHGDLVKFGCGYPARVRDHLREGAAPIQVLAARHADVAAAELALKRRYRNQVVAAEPARKRRYREQVAAAELPRSFGAGTEVLAAGTSVDLYAVLPHGADVTHRYRQAGRW